MSERLEIIKKLRSEGASIRMIDDVATYVGSYDSPVFLGTVEFIIKLKNMLSIEPVQVEQAVGVETEKETLENELENVDFNAAKSAVSGNDEMSEDERFKILDAILAIELQHLEPNEVETSVEPTTKSNEKKKLKSSKSNEKSFKTSLLDRLAKFNENSKKRQQQQLNQTEDKQQTTQKNVVSVKTQVETTHKSQSFGGLRLLKLDFLKALKMKKDPTMMGQEKFKVYKESREFAPVLTKSEKSAPETIQKATQDINVSKLIDNLVKSSKENKVEAVADKPVKAEKGKFEARVESASLPKADAEKVAKQTAKDAIEALQKSGVKTSAPDPAVKKEMDLQLAQNQQPAHQKQR